MQNIVTIVGRNWIGEMVYETNRETAGDGGTRRERRMTDEGAKNLMYAVVMQAVKDYKSALYRYNTKRDREKRQVAKNHIRQCETFFRKDINAYCDLDGEQIIAKVRSDVRQKLRKKGIIMEVPNDG